MVNFFKLKQPQKAFPLFAGWQETLVWSCLSGVMGDVYADSLDAPASAMALIGDFCFLAGKPMGELILYQRKHCRKEFVIMVPQNEQWEDAIERVCKEKAKKVMRYATRKETDVFDEKRLRRAVDALPDGYILKMVDETLFWRCKETEWCRDWVSQYNDYSMYQTYGLGAVILKDGEFVSGASSYAGYGSGIEIEIDTREDYRRRGLAYICGAKLILECLKRKWYPSWDAQNKWSLALAEKLGYHFDSAYAAYEVVQDLSMQV